MKTWAVLGVAALALAGCRTATPGPLLTGTVAVTSTNRDASCAPTGSSATDYVVPASKIVVTGTSGPKIIVVGTGKLYLDHAGAGQCVFRFSVRATEAALTYSFAVAGVDQKLTDTDAQLASMGYSDIAITAVPAT